MAAWLSPNKRIADAGSSDFEAVQARPTTTRMTHLDQPPPTLQLHPAPTPPHLDARTGPAPAQLPPRRQPAGTQDAGRMLCILSGMPSGLEVAITQHSDRVTSWHLCLEAGNLPEGPILGEAFGGAC